NSMELCDGAIVRRCVDGDVLAWRNLHRRYHPVAAAFLRRMGVVDEDIEDACQDVFLQVFRSLPKFRGEAELQTWLYRLCVTQASRLRRRRQLRRTLLTWLTLQPIEPVSAVGLVDGSARERLERALATLPDAERTVFVLFELEGVSGKRISEIVGSPEATVWRRLHYARRRFRSALGHASEDSG